MRRIVKKLYMLIFHPVLFLRFTIKTNLFVKKGCNIKQTSNIFFGKNVSIGYGARINFFGENKEKKLNIEDNVYICNRTSFIVGGKITIGKDTIIASDVAVISENHGMNPVDNIPYKDQPLEIDDIIIGEGCWIGEKVIILPGIKIGDKAIVGAGSIVTKSIPEYSIAVGNPAKVIKVFNKISQNWEVVK